MNPITFFFFSPWELYLPRELGVDTVVPYIDLLVKRITQYSTVVGTFHNQ